MNRTYKILLALIANGHNKTFNKQEILPKTLNYCFQPYFTFHPCLKSLDY